MEKQQQYPEISDILARKARGREERAHISFGEKLEILDKLRAQISPIVAARMARSHAKDCKIASNTDPTSDVAYLVELVVNNRI